MWGGGGREGGRRRVTGLQFSVIPIQTVGVRLRDGTTIRTITLTYTVGVGGRGGRESREGNNGTTRSVLPTQVVGVREMGLQ